MRNLLLAFSEIQYKFKQIGLRFSSFLIIGFIGFILQFIGYFLTNNMNMNSSDLATYYSMVGFDHIMISNWFNLFGTILIAIMFIGYTFGDKKKSLPFNISICGLVITESAIFLLTLFYIIFAYINRTKMFVSYNNFLFGLSVTRLVLLTISYIFMGLFSYKISKVKKQNILQKVLSWNITITSWLLAFMMTFVLYSCWFCKSLDMLTKLYNYKSVLPYDNTNNPILNCLTLAQTKRVIDIVYEASVIKTYPMFMASAIFTAIVEITYIIQIFVWIPYIFYEFIKSFDISRDKNPMLI